MSATKAASRATRTHGLRVTVFLHGAVVSQVMRWPRREGTVTVGSSAEDAIPTPSGEPLVAARWTRHDQVSLRALEPSAQQDGAMLLQPGGRWQWVGPSGVTVDLELVPQQRARRGGQDALGDVALLTLMLMLMVGTGQARILYLSLFHAGGGPPQTTWEPSPELLVRLMDQDYDGAEESYAQERVDRAELDRAIESEFMPAGSDGPMDRAGGGAAQGDEVRREEASDAAGVPSPRPEPKPPDTTLAEVEEPPAPPLEETIPLEVLADAEPLRIAEAEPLERVRPQEQGEGGEDRISAADPVERFVGWGFRDWFDVADARKESVQELSWQLEGLRQRLRINPDDPNALNLLGNYAYLAENNELARRSYERFVELYPEEGLGYNNLALTYKRAGDYLREEALYRQALKAEPDNPNTLNNLAVNLAHQGQFEDALAVMERLETLDPDNPYTDLHRAKIYATMGKRERAYRYLEAALKRAEGLSTLHHIEFRQDIRLEPAFDKLRSERRFARIIRDYYGPDADYLIHGGSLGGRDG